MSQATSSVNSSSPAVRRADPMLVLIGLFRLFKAALLMLVALGAHHLIHHNVYDASLALLRHLRVDPDNHHIHRLLAMTLSINDHRLRELEIGTMIYGSLFLIEGLGLLFQKHWAEWMTVITTSLFIPLEIHEIIHHTSASRIGLFVFNLVVVFYLIYKIQRDARRRREAQT